MFALFSKKKDKKASDDPLNNAFDPFDDGTKRDDDEEDDNPKPGVPFPTTYTFNDVTLPADFLSISQPPPDAQPITFKKIDFRNSVLPENEGRYAVVLDNVLSPSECKVLLDLAEQSVPLDRRGKSGNVFWRPALVNIGAGFEVLDPGYRLSDRLIWDHQEAVDRLWGRCAQVPEIRDALLKIDNEWDVSGPRGKKAKQQRPAWEFRRFNKRMRFLRYGPGQFFKAHCDGSYTEPSEPDTRTLFTVHLYLNDSQAEVGKDASDLVGGATSFLSRNEKRKMDIDPKMGRVLIFQHSGLYHSGDDVISGLKYTMRTDILYQRVYDD